MRCLPYAWCHLVVPICWKSVFLQNLKNFQYHKNHVIQRCFVFLREFSVFSHKLRGQNWWWNEVKISFYPIANATLCTSLSQGTPSNMHLGRTTKRCANGRQFENIQEPNRWHFCRNSLCNKLAIQPTVVFYCGWPWKSKPLRPRKDRQLWLGPARATRWCLAVEFMIVYDADILQSQ